MFFAYGPLDAKWERFGGRPDFKRLHNHLLQDRDTLLAHNDATQHRATRIWPQFADDGAPAIVEARAYVRTEAPAKIRELCAFQEARFGEAAQRLAIELQTRLGWAKRHEVDGELVRLRGNSGNT